MKQTRKLLTGICILVGILGAILTVILCLPSDKNQSTVNPDDTDILLFDKSGFRAEDITVKNQSGEYRLLGYDYSKDTSSQSSGDTQMIYTMQEYPDSLLSRVMTDMLLSECQTAAALRVVDKSGKKYTDYGLDKPSAETVIVYSDDSVIKMALGNTAPDQSGIYCRIDGDKNVYLVNSASVEMFLVDKLEMFDKHLSDGMEDSDNIVSVSVSGSGYEQPIQFSSGKDRIHTGTYIMTSPYPEGCNNSAGVNFANCFFDLTASETAAAGVKEDQLKDYGLDKPYMDIRITTEQSRSVEILASEKDGDGYFYMMKPGGNIIYREKAEETDWYGVSYRIFLNDSVFMPDMTYVGKAVISYGETTDEYVIENKTVINEMYEEVTQTTLYYQGEKLEYSRLFNFIQSVSNITREEEIPDSVEGAEKLLSVILTFEEDHTEEFALYRMPDNKTAAVLNGNIENYVDSEFARQVIEQASQVPSGEYVGILEKNAE